MILIAILLLTALNVATAALVLPRYFKRSAIFQFVFIGSWTLHYVVGNILVLLSRDLTYTLATFDEFGAGYLAALFVGQYFLWGYLALSKVSGMRYAGNAAFRTEALPAILLCLLAAAAGGALFIYQIGPDVFFSGELSQYRTGIGEIAGEGIGIFYYLATFIIPAALLAGGLAIDHPRARNVSLALLALVLVTLVFYPLGGRGRVLNVFFVLIIAYVLARRHENFLRAVNLRMIAVTVILFVGAYVWGATRELMDGASIALGPAEVINSLSIDMTRLPAQAFIFTGSPGLGTYFGAHYAEAALGPFWPLISNDSVGLIGDLSSSWYGTTVNNFDQRSAISPSFIGEMYLNFGIAGIIVAPLAFFGIVQAARAIAGLEHPVSTAAILYFIQFLGFHGGFYSLFDTLLLVVPLLLLTSWLATPIDTRPQSGRGFMNLQASPR